MFCGAKYTHYTLIPIIKHLITTTANKHPGKKSFIDRNMKNPLCISHKIPKTDKTHNSFLFHLYACAGRSFFCFVYTLTDFVVASFCFKVFVLFVCLFFYEDWAL